MTARTQNQAYTIAILLLEGQGFTSPEGDVNWATKIQDAYAAVPGGRHWKKDQGVKDAFAAYEAAKTTYSQRVEQLAQKLQADILPELQDLTSRIIKGQPATVCPVGPCVLESGHTGCHDSQPPRA